MMSHRDRNAGANPIASRNLNQTMSPLLMTTKHQKPRQRNLNPCRSRTRQFRNAVLTSYGNLREALRFR